MSSTASPSETNIARQLVQDYPAFHLGGGWHWNTTPATLEAIRVAVKPGDRTIETGVGSSTVVFAGAGAQHTAISPDREEHRLVREYCEQVGVPTDGLNFVEGLSDDVLPAILGRERTIDVAFIDGAHCFPFPAVDWHYISRALKVGGVLLMDDVPIPAATDVFRHMDSDPSWKLEGIFDGRSAAFRLLAEPPQGDDWPHQPYNRAYPDYGFMPWPKRARFQAAFRADRAKHQLATRYPSLGRLRERLGGR